MPQEDLQALLAQLDRAIAEGPRECSASPPIQFLPPPPPIHVRRAAMLEWATAGDHQSPVREASESQIVQYDHSRTGEQEAYLALIAASPRPRRDHSPIINFLRVPAQSRSPHGRSPLEFRHVRSPLLWREEPELFEDPVSPTQTPSPEELPWMSFDKIVYPPTPELNAPRGRHFYEALPSPLSTPAVVVRAQRTGMNPKYYLDNGSFVLKEFRDALVEEGVPAKFSK